MPDRLATKHAVRSKTIWGAVIMAAVSLVAIGGVEITEQETQQIVESVTALVGVVLVIWGRFSAKQKVVL